MKIRGGTTAKECPLSPDLQGAVKGEESCNRAEEESNESEGNHENAIKPKIFKPSLSYLLSFSKNC